MPIIESMWLMRENFSLYSESETTHLLLEFQLISFEEAIWGKVARGRTGFMFKLIMIKC